MTDCNKTTFVYGLIDPTTQELRYVGKTVKPIGYRLSDHISKARRGGATYRCNWVRGLLCDGLRPEVFLIETVDAGDDWRESESFWIAYYRSIGARLTNLTQGGDGTVGYSHSAPLKIAQSEYKIKLYNDEPWRRRQVAKFKRTAPPQKNNVSGFRGVTPARDRWTAAIKISGRHFFIGSFARDDDGRISAARACDRLEMFVLGPSEFSPRLLHEVRETQQWCHAYRDHNLDDVVGILRMEAHSRAPLRTNNKSGYRGVTLHKKAEKWQARTFISGQAHSVGLYPLTGKGAAQAALALDEFEYKMLGSGNFARRIRDLDAVPSNDNVNQQRKAA